MKAEEVEQKPLEVKNVPQDSCNRKTEVKKRHNNYCSSEEMENKKPKLENVSYIFHNTYRIYTVLTYTTIYKGLVFIPDR